ncbi:rhodanese-like domain-containing protein [Thermus tengchongensis]|uniref:Rhodanese-like domain-containing protein n=1 Tax=Thermus tengchongensis TaxID=1214928 RepID=A0ABY2K606_9DEIN|nr:rhodanese-like domain-containing protein [Thermus tengchongensis]TFU16131.1 rhodanese-like domain-containing protein [Thermus tengchongensis]
MTRRALLALLPLVFLAACGPKGSYQNVGPEELYRALESGAVVVDVRTPQEFAEGHVPGAINLPVENVVQWADTLPKDKPVYLYCRSGNRSRQAAEYLKKKGYTNLYNLEGGILAIQREGFPLVR